MVAKYILLIFIVLISKFSFAAEVCIKGTEYEPRRCFFKLPKIDRITIKENSAGRSVNEKVDPSCKKFIVNEKIIIKFLSKSKKVSRQDFLEKLDWSPCHASGEVYFADGTVGQWEVRQYQTGQLSTVGNDTVYLYCDKCHFKPFVW